MVTRRLNKRRYIGVSIKPLAFHKIMNAVDTLKINLYNSKELSNKGLENFGIYLEGGDLLILVKLKEKGVINARRKTK